MITLQQTLKPFKWNPDPKSTTIFQPTLKPFKWNLNPKPTTILKIKNQLSPIQPPDAFPTHVNKKFIETLTGLYKKQLRPEYEVLDLMCSRVSHLPKEVKYKKVVEHGLNAQELAKNPRLDFENASFNAVLLTASVQYLQEPEKVFAEVLRLLRPNGVFIVSFNTHMLYEKATDVWKNETESGKKRLVVKYFKYVEGFTEPEIVPKPGKGLWSKVQSSMMKSKGDPFCAFIAKKKLIYE
ncbi:S-adenosyl-L-methionine-dependent methyltransferases superfamily protein [Artemisia annua]|uniref:S-adenosyl-L-methionine-dependent methyltransferases superfamily protein n=1 Tax=Artemisia annua TaxID=35608 RepID=A0A2U1LL32_ARTAN|nr:S-adenosyl-L-methionine-dependent methyltransferases superfamily protein [Artemisia annua]